MIFFPHNSELFQAGYLLSPLFICALSALKNLMAFPGKITSEEGPAADHPHNVFITHCPPADNTVISRSTEKFSSSGSAGEFFSTWLLPTAGLVRRQFIFSVFRCLFNLQRGQNVSFSHFFSRVKTERRIRNVYFVSAVYIEKKRHNLS